MSTNDERQLLRRLRGLPQPTVPPGLEAKLLAGIPRTQRPPAARGRRWAIVCGVAATAAAALVALVVLFTQPGEGVDRDATATTMESPSTAIESPHDVRPDFVHPQTSAPNFKETRPWDILPPLPQRSL